MIKDFSSDLRQAKNPVPFLAIDMWGIEGPYADGNWHELIHDFARNWVRRNPEQQTATLWSTVQPSALFPNGTSCYLAGSSKLPFAFLEELESHLLGQFGQHARIGGEILVSKAEGWRPYLHFDSGEAWEQIDAYEWRPLQNQEKDIDY
ncbi:hypothetical protein RBU07_03980 [Pseudomonas aeruginosa]|nr:hypothetical protein [Pseudomonas aeruginosa]